MYVSVGIVCYDACGKVCNLRVLCLIVLTVCYVLLLCVEVLCAVVDCVCCDIVH